MYKFERMTTKCEIDLQLYREIDHKGEISNLNELSEVLEELRKTITDVFYTDNVMNIEIVKECEGERIKNFAVTIKSERLTENF